MPIFQSSKAGGCSMLILGFIFAIVGGCVLLFLGSDTTLTCQRSTDTCILEKRGTLGRKEVVAKFPLSRVKSAEIESRQGSRTKIRSRPKPTYQVVLRTEDGPIPFSQVWTGDREAHKQSAAQINTYLASSEESLFIFQSGKTVRLIGCLFFGVGGLMFLRGLWGVARMFLTLGFSLFARG